MFVLGVGVCVKCVFKFFVSFERSHDVFIVN